MTPAVLIARLVGPLFVVIGIGILLNAPFYAGMIVEAVHSPTLVYLSGVAVARSPASPSSTPIGRGPRTGASSSPFSAGCCVIAGIVRIVLPQVTAVARDRDLFRTDRR